MQPKSSVIVFLAFTLLLIDACSSGGTLPTDPLRPGNVLVVAAPSLQTTEAGGTVSFTVALDVQPISPVTVRLTSSKTSEGTVFPSTLTFDVADFGTPQTVTVTGVDDADRDGPATYSIAFAVQSNDRAYAAATVAPLSITNIDDDGPAINVTPTSGLTTSEGGANASFTVTLTTAPTADVTLAFVSSNTDEGTLSSSSYAFTATNWQTPLTVIITGVDDAIDDGDVAYTVFVSSSTTDPDYSKIDPANVSVVNLDNDVVASNYNQTIVNDAPVGFWDMSGQGTTEVDLTQNGRAGTYHNRSSVQATMPNNDKAALFNGIDQYLQIASNPAFSIATTKKLTVEAWIRPDVSNFPNATDGLVNWLGKCDSYSPTCEWQTRMYNANHERCSRVSAYAFNSTAGLGSGAFWQQSCGSGTIQTGHWYHIVAQYQTESTPPACSVSSPGTVDVWVNGVYWNQSSHGDTGCMSQYSVKPTSSISSVTIGTMARDNWFKGSIAKVAIYNYLLNDTRIGNHYRSMTGTSPQGSCATTCRF